MDFHTLDQLLPFLQAADAAAHAGRKDFPCPLCGGRAVIETAPLGRSACCPACGVSASL